MNLLKIKKLVHCFFYPNFFLSYINNVCPLFELKNLFKYTGNLDYLLDIGSNKGQFLILFNYFYPNAKILSFEPQTKYLNIQKKIIKKNIKFFNICLGNKNKKLTFNITNKEDSSSLLKPITFKKSIYKIKRKILVNVKKLDDVINLPKNKDILIKIDVQGYEKFVLEGANKNLSKIKYIIIELSNKKFYDFQIKNNEMINFLKKKNFRLIKYFNKNFLGKKNYQADYLFINENLEN